MLRTGRLIIPDKEYGRPPGSICFSLYIATYKRGQNVSTRPPPDAERH